MLVLTQNGWRRVLWEIALVDAFSHALSAFVKVVLKAWDNQVIGQADNCRSSPLLYCLLCEP